MKTNLRLYWGENYSEKPKHVKALIKKAAIKSVGCINLYPGEVYQQTVNLLAKHLQISEKEILLGNGIDGFLNLIGKCLIKEKDKVAALSPSYCIYEKVINLYKGKILKIKVNIGQTFTANQLLTQIEKTQMFFLSYPNNPTGQYVTSVKDVEIILKKYKGLLVVDECYFGIGNLTILNLVNKYPNLIVIKSFSKSMGMAGLRFGYAISHKKNIDLMQKYSLDIEIDQLNIFTHLLAQAVLLYEKELFITYKQFKQKFIDLLEKKTGYEVIPTDTSFILLKIKGCQNSQIVSELAKQGIYIKDTKIYANFPKDIIMFSVPPKNKWQYFVKNLLNI